MWCKSWRERPPMYFSTPIKQVGREQPEWLSFFIHAKSRTGKFKVSIIERSNIGEGSNLVLQQNLWSVVNNDITDIKQSAGSVKPLWNFVNSSVKIWCVVFLDMELLFKSYSDQLLLNHWNSKWGVNTLGGLVLWRWAPGLLWMLFPCQLTSSELCLFYYWLQ